MGMEGYSIHLVSSARPSQTGIPGADQRFSQGAVDCANFIAARNHGACRLTKRTDNSPMNWKLWLAPGLIVTMALVIIVGVYAFAHDKPRIERLERVSNLERTFSIMEIKDAKAPQVAQVGDACLALFGAKGACHRQGITRAHTAADEQL